MTDNRSSSLHSSKRVLALCGGVGGAKLAQGLNELITAPDSLTIVVNTGDDFEHLGLNICPDLDSVVYALANKNDTTRGWGRADETWHCLEALKELGAQSWFALGDRDLAMHLERSHRLRSGQTLSEVTALISKQLGIRAHVVPMSDNPVRTVLHTDEGELAFQDYFVRKAGKPKVESIAYTGADTATPQADLMARLTDPDLDAIIICPSNPQLSIEPILALNGVREALRRASAPIVAVSPLIGGKAVKGPAAKIMQELEIPVDSTGIAQVYLDFIKGLVIDRADELDAAYVSVPTVVTRTLMKSPEDALNLAQATLEFAGQLRLEATQTK